jgi:endonuclease YncB( thermonuclease family)
MATNTLRLLIGSDPVTCQNAGTDRYGRAIGLCFVRGVDVGAYMVREGRAVAYTRYSRRYVAEEASAKQDARGIWAGDFELPEIWRRKRMERQ